VKWDPMFLHQCDKILWPVTGKRGNAEELPGRQVILRRGEKIGEVAATAAGNRDFQPNASVMLKKRDAAPTPSGSEGTHQPGRAAADNDDVVALQLLGRFAALVGLPNFAARERGLVEVPEQPIIVRHIFFQAVIPALWKLARQALEKRQERLLRRLQSLPRAQEIADPVAPAKFLFVRPRDDRIHRTRKVNARAAQEVVLLHRASIEWPNSELKLRFAGD
jgi:hypothetical protein